MVDVESRGQLLRGSILLQPVFDSRAVSDQRNCQALILFQGRQCGGDRYDEAPVATVGVDGAKNAAYLAARMLARKYPEVKGRLEADLEKQRKRYDNPFKPAKKKRTRKK